jgi:hypothetical protein
MKQIKGVLKLKNEDEYHLALAEFKNQNFEIAKKTFY